MSQQALAEAVAQFVEETDWVTFVQIGQFLKGLDIPHRGDVNLTMSCDRNVLLWSGMSEPMCAALVQLMDERRIFAHRSTVAVYHVQGGVLSLPLADEPDQRGLGQPHWLPVAFRPLPPTWARH